MQEEPTDKAKPSKTHAKHKQPKRKTNAPPPPQRSGPDHHSNTVRPEGVKRANVGLQAQISMRHMWARRRTRHATFVERHMLLSDMGDRKQRGMRRKWSKPSQNNRCQHQRRLDADDAEGLRGKPPKKNHPRKASRLEMWQWRGTAAGDGGKVTQLKNAFFCFFFSLFLGGRDALWQN